MAEILDPESMAFLAGITEAAIEASRVRPGERPVDTVPANETDRTFIRPGGRDCYPAVWTQDFAMTLATGFVTPEETLDHLLLVARGQNGPVERPLKSGASIPAHAIPDHVLFDGSPVYFPGTYSSGDDQGGEPWGLRPPVNNHYDFILIAWQLWKATGHNGFLSTSVAGLTVIERLRLAFGVPRVDRDTGLVFTDEAARAVGFIFCDSVTMTGNLLFASLLRWRAAHQLAELEEALGEHERAKGWRQTVSEIPAHLPKVFSAPERIGGWLLAATGIGRQPDVWGTIYALYLGLLDESAARAARNEIVRALEEGTIAFEGAIRHVPTNHDASPDSAWEKSCSAHNTYQNGAYWHTPSGWLIAVLQKSHPLLARRIFADMISNFRREDFRKGDASGAPWECVGPDRSYYKCPIFLASTALPYGVLRSLARIR